MSKDIYLYAITPVSEDFPDTVNVDDESIDVDYTEAKNAEDWAKEVGRLCTVQYTKVDFNEVCEKEFAKKFKSFRFRYPDEVCFLDEDGNLIGAIKREELKKHEALCSIPAYVYHREYFTEFTDYLSIFAREEDHILERAELKNAKMKVIQEVDEIYDGDCPDHLGQILYALNKAETYMDKSEMVLVEIC